MVTAAAHALEYLTFTLGHAQYGLDSAAVVELRGVETVTRIANAPGHIVGVVKLRGVVAPVMDLRLRLGVAMPAGDQTGLVIVLDTGARTFGVLVDSVCGLTELAPSQIAPAPAAPDGGCVTGTTRAGERPLILIDVARLAARDDLALAA